MSNIEYWRQLYHKMLNVQKDSIPREGVLFLRKGPRFRVLRNGLDLHILRSRKEPGLCEKDCRYRLRLYLNINVRLHAIIFKEYSRNKYCLNKSNLQMSNIEYLRQLYHK